MLATELPSVELIRWLLVCCVQPELKVKEPLEEPVLLVPCMTWLNSKPARRECLPREVLMLGAKLA